MDPDGTVTGKIDLQALQGEIGHNIGVIVNSLIIEEKLDLHTPRSWLIQEDLGVHEAHLENLYPVKNIQKLNAIDKIKFIAPEPQERPRILKDIKLYGISADYEKGMFPDDRDEIVEHVDSPNEPRPLDD